MARVDLKRSFGNSVREWRGRRGISQEELAERAGLHRTYVSDIERGARNVSLESIEKLASALEVSVSTLFVSNVDEVGERIYPNDLVDILLVEDNNDDADLTVRALQQAKIANRVNLVRDGVSALQYIFGLNNNRPSSPLNACPHLILLDLNLPKIDGLEVLRRLKSDSRTRSIPVIVLTVSRHDADIRTSKKLGADGYIVKPVGFQNLSEVTPQLSLQWALLKGAKIERS